jgi:hypothetical protein
MPHKQPVNAPRVPHNVLTLSQKVDECKSLHGGGVQDDGGGGDNGGEDTCGGGEGMGGEDHMATAESAGEAAGRSWADAGATTLQTRFDNFSGATSRDSIL